MSPIKHDESLQKLSQCISDIMARSSSNKLKLNQSKTEILQITFQFINYGGLPSLDVAGVDVISSKKNRDLGEIMDNTLNMQQHIRNTVILVYRAAAFGSSKISKMRKFLNGQSTVRLIHAFVTSHLDYCNLFIVTLRLLRYSMCRIQQPTLSLNSGNMKILPLS